MPEEFCVICGRSDMPTEGGVCPDCFAVRNPLIEVVDRPKVILCPSCGARQVGSHWERRGSPGLLGPEDLMPLLRPREDVGVRRVSWEETGIGPLRREMRGRAAVRFRGVEREVAVELTVQLEHRTCPECSRRSGHYYTALLQLRGPEERSRSRPREERERLRRAWDGAILEARSEWRQALSWMEERPEGWDFYLVDTVSARALARWLKGRLGARLTESPSLYGRKDGRDVYRVTFCLRVPPAGAAGRAPRPSRAPRSPATVENPPVER